MIQYCVLHCLPGLAEIRIKAIKKKYEEKLREARERGEPIEEPSDSSSSEETERKEEDVEEEKEKEEEEDTNAQHSGSSAEVQTTRLNVQCIDIHNYLNYRRVHLHWRMYL